MWPKTVKQAKIVQEKLRPRKDFKDRVTGLRYVCGCDVAYSRDNKVKSACAVFSYPDLKNLEIKTYQARPESVFPYIPGLLSFREIPFVIKAIEKIKSPVDVFIVDGQGRLHPHEMGLAVHLGILLQKPTIGCAKTALFGKEEEVVNIRGAYSFIKSECGDIIGAKVRTRKNVKPVYVSQGWGISLMRAIEIVVNCCAGYKIPEVIRAAHKEAEL